MPQLAIVAIPRKDDYVWNISSEKVPHLTLLMLGDNLNDPTIPRMAEFLEHVANTSMCRFGLDVDRRGELGEDQADVLFFNKRTAHFLETIRGFLLGDKNISNAYKSVTQFPEWIPHLTLGFPKTPAHPDTRDWPGTTWVNFDRVALWTGDSEGPEFELKDQLGMDMWAGDTFEEVLEHFGIKGMKWGVRRSRSEIDSGASEDHNNARAASQKARKGGGTKALSNQELQSLITRANLETQYSKIAPSKFTRGKKILGGVLATGKTVNDVITFVNSPAGKIVKDRISAATKVAKK